VLEFLFLGAGKDLNLANALAFLRVSALTLFAMGFFAFTSKSSHDEGRAGNKRRIYWLVPTLMVGSWVLGIALSLAHHFTMPASITRLWIRKASKCGQLALVPDSHFLSKHDLLYLSGLLALRFCGAHCVHVQCPFIRWIRCSECCQIPGISQTGISGIKDQS
jgi:hypothetical protein